MKQSNDNKGLSNMYNMSTTHIKDQRNLKICGKRLNK